MNTENFILKTDSYKPSHWKQYPKNTRAVYSFFESRGGQFDDTIFFGLQYILMRHFAGVRVTDADIEEAKEIFSLHFGTDTILNEAGWRYIVREHGGRLPLRIKAVPEGMRVPTKNVLMTIENTDERVPWLTNYVETLLSQVWYPTTVATQSNAMRSVIMRYLEETGDTSLINFKLHDFGYRGSTSVESAGIGGLAHLVNFEGTDTLEAIMAGRRYYSERMAGFSIPAAEHSTITSWGKTEEAKAYANMLEQFPEGLVAVVSDSYDIYAACRDIWGKELREKVLARNGTLVVRPDSGEPSAVVVDIMRILARAFGTTKNEKGYLVLDPHVRVIQGDGIDLQSLQSILFSMKLAGFSADNIAFGSGGGLLQKVNRDTCKFALKCSAIKIGDEWHDVFKNPVTDPGKRSKAGRLSLVHTEDDTLKTVREEVVKSPSLLETVFENGTILRETTLSQVRERALS